MILEYSQILSTAHRVLDNDLSLSFHKNLYKPTHVNHPSVKWTMKSDKNYRWLFDLLKALHKEYTYRYNREHKSGRLLSELQCLPRNIPITKRMTRKALAMPEEFKSKNSELSYRQYYIKAKRHIATWKKRPVPNWYN